MVELLIRAAETDVPTPDSIREREAAGRSPVHELREMERLIDRLAARWLGNTSPLRPRRSRRKGSHQNFALTPLSDGDLHPIGEMRRVQARDVSRDGISFQHRAPLACRFAALTFPLSADHLQTVIARLKWCRFTRGGTYHSGGRLLQRRQFGWEGTINLEGLPLG